MIISHVVKKSEYNGEQVIVVKGSMMELDTEITNIVREHLKNGFPEDVLIESFIDAIEDHHKEK